MPSPHDDVISRDGALTPPDSGLTSRKDRAISPAIAMTFADDGPSSTEDSAPSLDDTVMSADGGLLSPDGVLTSREIERFLLASL